MISWFLVTVASTARVCDVTHFGAKGDNMTKDTEAIKQAITACSVGGVILLPATEPRVYISGAFNLSSNQVLRVDPNATLAASTDVEDFPIVSSFASYGGSRDVANSTCRFGALVGAVGAHNVSVNGGGAIDGRGGVTWWPLKDDSKTDPTKLPCSRPHLLEFEDCDGVSLEHLVLRDSPFWTVHWIYSRNILANNVTVLAPPTRGNTDGFNPDSSANVLIKNCFVSNGDDGVAIKSGMDWAGQQVHMPSENITVVNLTTHGRGGVAIGSEMSGGVRHVTLKHIRVLGERGVHLKTCKGRGGFIEDITMVDVAGKPIELWPTYSGCNASGPWPHIANISVINSTAGCSIGCKGIPEEYCDESTFVFDNACGRHPTPSLVVRPCKHSPSPREQWVVPEAGAKPQFVTSANQTLNVHGCSRDREAPVGIFPVPHSRKSRCGDLNLMWSRVSPDRHPTLATTTLSDSTTFALKNAWSGLCLEAWTAQTNDTTFPLAPLPLASSTSLRQNTCDDSSPGQQWAMDGGDRLTQSGGRDCLTIVVE